MIHSLSYQEEILGYVHYKMKCSVVYLLFKGVYEIKAKRFSPQEDADCVLEMTNKIPTCIGCSV